MADELPAMESPFGDGPLEDVNPEATPEPTPESEPLDPQAQALVDSQAREQEANARADAAQQNLTRALATPTPAPPPQTVLAPPAPMPDPVTDAAGFQTWLASEQAKTTATHQGEIARLRAENQMHAETRSADQLFNEFVATRPGLANQREIVDAAARKAGVTLNEPTSEIFRKTEEALRAAGVNVGERQPLPKKGAAAAAAAVGRGSAGPRPAPKPATENDDVDFVDQIADRAHELGLN